MEIIAVLREYAEIDDLIETAEENIIRLKAQMVRITGVISDMPRGGRGSDWADVISRCMDLEEQLHRYALRKIDLWTQISTAFEALSDTERQVLDRHYLRKQPTRRIAREMHFSKSAIPTIEKRAAEKVGKIGQMP